MTNYIEELREELERYESELEDCRERLTIAQRQRDAEGIEYWKEEIQDIQDTIRDVREDLETAEENEAEYDSLGITDYDSPIQAGYKLAGMNMRDFL